MGQEIVLFHSALGLRPAVLAFADALRAAGHTVHTPDLFDGETFDDLPAGAAKRDSIGIEALIGRARAAVDLLPDDVVYAGFSMGAGPAELLAATRPGARAAILMHGVFAPADYGIPTWPGIPAEVHYAADDPEVDEAAAGALAEAVRASGAPVTIHTYDRGGHLFEDPDNEGYDASSAELLRERVLAFLETLDERSATSGDAP